jgi:hypothetical protein
MSPLVRRAAAIVAAFLLFSAIPTFAADAAGTATGSFTVNGKSTPLKYAVAVEKPGSFDKNKKEVHLLISNVQISAATLADPFGLMKLPDDQKLIGIEVSIADDGEVVSGQLYNPAFVKIGGSFSSTGTHELQKGKEWTKTKVSGKLSSKKDTFSDYTYEYSASFSTPISDPKAAKAAALAASGAKALGSGGGAPGDAYRKYIAAMRSGDLKAIRKAVAKERTKDMDRPEFPQMLSMIQEMMPKNIKVTGGNGTASTATLDVTGEEADKTKSKGTVEMVLEEGTWRVSKESWSSGTD